MNPYTYNGFTKHIDLQDIKIILELGAFDGLYTKEIHDFYKLDITYSTEVNPKNINI
jgi:hypothetical protein